MKLLFAASECAPFFKTGGLGDVLGALPKELAKEGNDVRVVLPYFKRKMPDKWKEQLEDVIGFNVKVGWRDQYCGVKRLVKEGVIYYFLDNEYYFDRDGLYGYGDDGERFAFFSQAAIEFMEKVDFIPDVYHVNDWQAAMIPVLLRDKYSWIYQLRDIKTVLTIHNILFQGNYDQEVLSNLFGIGYESFHDHGLKQGDRVNFLKGAIYYSDLVTTVSPTYADEIKTEEFGYGLESDLRNIDYKLIGILNGIDYDVFDPERDETIPENFSIENTDGKKVSKAALQERIGLPTDSEVALIGIVSRLDEQKGIQLIAEAMEELMEYRNVQFVLLGTGKAHFEHSFHYFTDRYPDKFKGIIDFDVELAQWIYAGCDMFLMPSGFEPCGLSQLNSLRYGTLPIVHETGGLVDTVTPYNHEEVSGNGFTFYGYNKDMLLDAVDRSLKIYYDYPEQWQQLMRNAMTENNSWEKSAKEYMNQYRYLVF